MLEYDAMALSDSERTKTYKLNLKRDLFINQKPV